MTIKDILKIGTKKLNENQIEDSNLIVKELLCYVLEVDKQYLVVNGNQEIEEQVYQDFGNYINEIINGKPLQYITNKQEFMGYSFFVNENVLIPQPDTEIVVEKVIELYNKKFSKSNVKILDLCTGSGAIAIALDKILNKDDNIEIYATDISESALEVAKINKEKLKSNVKFMKSDMFENISERFDIIVSNPPYIETETIKQLAKDVQNEPHIALDGGKDGLVFYRIIANKAHKYLKDQGLICLEIGYNQNRSVEQIFKNYDCYRNIEFFKDFSNNYRCAVIY